MQEEGISYNKKKITMSFVVYDLTFLVIFSAVIAIILVINRKKIKREGVFLLYRTSWGIRLIDNIAKKHKKFLNSFEWVLIVSGYILMAAGIYTFVQFIYIFLSNPAFVKLVKIPPIAPLIPYLPQLFNANYLPAFYFTYWIIVLAITAIVHEFFHGIFAKARDIKIKATGFAFVGPFFGAFVEPDEKKVSKMKKKPQIAFLSAGSFSNLLIGIVFLFLFWGYSYAAYAPAGVLFSDYSRAILNTSYVSVTNQTIYIGFDGGLNLTRVFANGTSYYIDSNYTNSLANYSLVYAYEDTPALRNGLVGAIIKVNSDIIKTDKDLSNIILSKKPGDNITIETDYNNEIKDYNVTLISNPGNSSRPYLGIAQINLAAINAQSSIIGKIRNKLVFFKDPNTYYKPRAADELTIFVYNLLWWIILVNFGVALFNMLPFGAADGGRVFYLTVLGIVKSEKAAKIIYRLATYLIILSFVAVTVFWLFNFR